MDPVELTLPDRSFGRILRGANFYGKYTYHSSCRNENRTGNDTLGFRIIMELKQDAFVQRKTDY